MLHPNMEKFSKGYKQNHDQIFRLANLLHTLVLFQVLLENTTKLVYDS